MQPEKLTSAAEVMDALGGTAAVAELTNRKISAVSNWRAFKKFPANTYVTMKDALAAKGKQAPDSLWGMADAETAA